MNIYDVIVIGGGPAGLAAAVSAKREGADVLLIEREERLGGILKQCIHDGFGLQHFGERLTGPEYAERFIRDFREAEIPCMLQTFVTDIEKPGEPCKWNGREEDPASASAAAAATAGLKAGGSEAGTETGQAGISAQTQPGTEPGDAAAAADCFRITAVSAGGVAALAARTLVLATGCRERTAKQVFIHGTRPAGVLTAGTAQNLVNLQGQMPTKRCVILGSGDIGMIMARRLTLEGAEVVGVYEVKPEPSGLSRNIMQCLDDYDIPLHLSQTVTRVFGHERLEAVEVAEVDEKMKPVPGTEKRIECDALILSVGLIPENEVAQSIGVTLNGGTKGPVCDDSFMTNVPGVFSCGNALHVNDLVDYVTESGILAGKSAARYAAAHRDRDAEMSNAGSPGTAGQSADSARNASRPVPVKTAGDIQYIVPQMFAPRVPAPGKTEDAGASGNADQETVIYFRGRRTMRNAVLTIETDGKKVFEKKYQTVRPPEMERLVIDRNLLGLHDGADVCVKLEGGAE